MLDDDGTPTTGHFVFRDERGRVYPARSRRLAPDFFFHDQIYRKDGETVLLPAGKYTSLTRAGRSTGAEAGDRRAHCDNSTRRVSASSDGSTWRHAGWFSGDHHVHAAGCAHYSSPTQGVEPADMMRHIVGEDLNVGCVLTWGPCWYHQKQFFDGKVHALSTPQNLMRYDVEVSGFPSSHAGHLVLLRLKEDDYPGTKRIEDWPSWDLPVLKWGKEQGGVVGFRAQRLGSGRCRRRRLPTYDMPPFDGIGANEFIVDVTHDACDFISSVDTPFVWEINIWYHTLNCGYTTRISGETDFPCIYGERVGLGRIYVKMPAGRTARFRSLGRRRTRRPQLLLRRSHALVRFPDQWFGRRRAGRRRSAKRTGGEKRAEAGRSNARRRDCWTKQPETGDIASRDLGRATVLAHRAGPREGHAANSGGADRQWTGGRESV